MPASRGERGEGREQRSESMGERANGSWPRRGGRGEGQETTDGQIQSKFDHFSITFYHNLITFGKTRSKFYRSHTIKFDENLIKMRSQLEFDHIRS